MRKTETWVWVLVTRSRVFSTLALLTLGHLLCIPRSGMGRRRWHPSPVLLPGKPHGWRSLVGCSPWGLEESDTTERLPFTFHFRALEKEMATHSSVLAWRMPGTRSLVGCRLWGRTESDSTEAT